MPSAPAQRPASFCRFRWVRARKYSLLPYPLTAGQGPHQLAVELARMVVIHVFDNTALFEMRGAKTARQCPVFLPEPLPVYQQRETLFESELAHIGGLYLSMKGLCHSMQFHRVQLFNRRLI